jgi:hypothetical protein
MSRRATGLSSAPDAASRTYTSRAVGSCTCGSDLIEAYPLELGPPWTREPSSRRGSPLVHASTAIGSEIHGSAVVFSLKNP